MASLVAPLASGINGAASGSAEFYLRGTNTTANGYVFSDKDAQTAATTHTLDANGGIARYVTTSVDVVVKNSSAATVRTFTWEDQAKTVEVTNAGFTGTHPTTGSQTPGGRTNLDAALTSLYTSLGAVDGKVLVNGGGVNIKDAIGSSTGIFINVKTTTYGAVGNGTNDDTSAIQAALNAANTAGGGIVYFPPGTYLINQALALPADGNTLLLGVGPRISKIKMATTAQNTMTVNGPGMTFLGLGFERSATGHSGAHIANSNEAGTVVINCDFTGLADGQISVSSGGSIRFVACRFVMSEVASNAIEGDGDAILEACRIEMTAAVTGAIFGMAAGRIMVSGCHFVISDSSGGPEIFSNTEGAMVGCRWDITGAGTITSNGTDMAISGCSFDGTSATLALNGAGLSQEGGCAFNVGTLTITQRSSSRDTRRSAQSINGTTCTLNTDSFGVHEISHTNGASMTITPSLPTVTTAGQKFWLIYKNTTGGAITPAFAAANVRASATVAVADGAGAAWTFVWMEGIARWVAHTSTMTTFTL